VRYKVRRASARGRKFSVQSGHQQCCVGVGTKSHCCQNTRLTRKAGVQLSAEKWGSRPSRSLVSHDVRGGGQISGPCLEHFHCNYTALVSLQIIFNVMNNSTK